MRVAPRSWTHRDLVWVAVIFAAIVIGHIFLRERPWAYEWDWAIWQFNFVVVLLGPAVAGAAALLAAEHARVDAAVRLSSRRLTVLERMLRPVWVAAACTFVSGVVVSLAVVGLRGVPGSPSAMMAVSVVPALLQLLLAGLTGCLFGLAIRRWVAAPVAAVLVFATVILLYQLGAKSLVIVGGATGSVFGLQPDPRRLGWQVLIYATLIAALAWGSISLLARSVGWVQRYSPLGVLAAGVVVAVAMPRYPVFEPVPAAMDCFVDGATSSVLCAAPGYRDLLPDAARRLAPFAEAARELAGRDDMALYAQQGGVIPDEYARLARGEIGVEFLRGGHPQESSLAAALALEPWLPACNQKMGPSTVIAVDVVYSWVMSHGVSGTDPIGSARGPGTVTIDDARDGLQVLKTCG